MNFLKEGQCGNKCDDQCPFLHFIERRRDKVIQDDFEFKDFLSQQESIVDKFLSVLNFKQIGTKNEFFNKSDPDMVFH